MHIHIRYKWCTLHIYIYIYIERERYIYIYIYIRSQNNKQLHDLGSFTSQDFVCFFCAVFARIRRLRKSPRYLLVILRWKVAVSANLRSSPQHFNSQI